MAWPVRSCGEQSSDVSAHQPVDGAARQGQGGGPHGLDRDAELTVADDEDFMVVVVEVREPVGAG